MRNPPPPIGTLGTATFTEDGTTTPVILTIPLLCECAGGPGDSMPFKVCADCLPDVTGVGHTVDWDKS